MSSILDLINKLMYCNRHTQTFEANCLVPWSLHTAKAQKLTSSTKRNASRFFKVFLKGPRLTSRLKN